MNELNPNHPVVNEMREQWHKLAAILMHKFGKTEIQITTEDIAAFSNSGVCNITVHPKGKIITLKLVNDAEAMRMARKEGGLPA